MSAIKNLLAFIKKILLTCIDFKEVYYGKIKL